MFLAVFLLATLLVAVCTGRDFSGAERIRVRVQWLFPLSLLMQVAVFNQGHLGELLEPYRTVLHEASYLLLVYGMLANARVRGFGTMLAGGLLNLIAISTHGGYMPTTLAMAKAVSQDAYYEAVANGMRVWNNSMLVQPGHCPLDRLGDAFALPPWFPMTNVFSIGDVLICMGMMAFVWKLSAKAEKGTVAKETVA